MKLYHLVLLAACAGALAVACGSSNQGSGGSGGGGAGTGGTGGGGTGGDGGGSGSGGGGAGTGGAGGGSGGGGSGGSGPIAAADFCDAMVAMLCEAEQGCCAGAKKYLTAEACIAGEIGGCDPGLFTDARAGYDDVLAQQFVYEYQVLASTCDVDVTYWLASAAGLENIFNGTLGLGGDCTPADDTDAAAGLACTEPNVCRLDVVALAVSGECGARATLGQPCYLDTECTDTLRCDPHAAWIAGTGTCKALLANGDDCVRNGDCESFNCAVDVCAAATADSAYCLE